MGKTKYVKILPEKDSVYSKYKVRVGYRGSGYEYTASHHKTKSAAMKAASKERRKK